MCCVTLGRHLAFLGLSVLMACWLGGGGRLLKASSGLLGCSVHPAGPVPRPTSQGPACALRPFLLACDWASVYPLMAKSARSRIDVLGVSI